MAVKGGELVTAEIVRVALLVPGARLVTAMPEMPARRSRAGHMAPRGKHRPAPRRDDV